MNEIQKFCPLVKKPCAKEQCEFFHDTLKRCQISVISYNIFRLTEPKSSKSGVGRNAGVPLLWATRREWHSSPICPHFKGSRK